jgi:hypothetical protein
MKMKIQKLLSSGSIVPGGSIIASEMMRDELFAAKEKGIDVDRIYG